MAASLPSLRAGAAPYERLLTKIRRTERVPAETTDGMIRRENKV